METFEQAPQQFEKIKQIKGIDIGEGLRSSNNNVNAYLEIVESFLEDAQSKVPEFKFFSTKETRLWSEAELEKFTKAVHAIKGAAAIIGARFLSKKAADLEIAAKSGDLDTITRDFPDFFADLKTMAEEVESAMKNA